VKGVLQVYFEVQNSVDINGDPPPAADEVCISNGLATRLTAQLSILTVATAALHALCSESLRLPYHSDQCAFSLSTECTQRQGFQVRCK
jgi:hypothetical protein